MIGTVAALIVALWPRDRLLLHRATRVLDFTEWKTCCWLTDKQLTAEESISAAPQWKWLHRLIPAIHTEDQARMAILIGEPEAFDLRELGVMPPETPDEQSYESSITLLDFSPDETKVSFVYKDTLYTAPVD